LSDNAVFILGFIYLIKIDCIQIRDGDTGNSSLIGTYCGPPSAIPDPIFSSFNYLWIRFKTDGGVENKGFVANYSTFDTGKRQ